MNFFLIPFFVLFSGIVTAQETPQPQRPKAFCLPVEMLQSTMNESGFVKFFTGKVSPKIDVIVWRNEEKKVIINTTIQEVDGVYVACIAGPPLVAVREYGPV